MRKLTAIILALLAPAAAAQSSRGSAKPEVRLLAERTPEEIGQVRLVSGDWKSDEFDLPNHHLSSPVVLPERVFQVWSSAMNAAIAKVSLPEPGRSFIVILIPSPKGGFNPVVLSANNPKFRPGDIYFYNHADKTVLGYVGTAKFTLAPSRGTTVRPAGAKEDGKFYEVGLGFRDDDGDRPLSLARWPVQEGIRMYVFFYINPNTERIDFRAVEEFVEPDQAPG